MALDPRIMRVGIQIGDDLQTYEKLAISCSGTKLASSTQGECEIKITNLAKDVRENLLAETSPFNSNRKRKKVVIEVGRESYGTSVLFVGDIFRTVGGQAPDNVTTIKCLTGQFLKGNIITREGQKMENLSTVAGWVAEDNGLTLQFEVDDKKVANYSFSGASIKQIEKLAEIAEAEVFVDGEDLVVKPIDAPLSGSVKLISQDSGMIGKPEQTETGVKVTFLYDPDVKLGGSFELKSISSPSLDGAYVIYKLDFSVSNRETPFYYTVEARRI